MLRNADPSSSSKKRNLCIVCRAPRRGHTCLLKQPSLTMNGGVIVGLAARGGEPTQTKDTFINESLFDTVKIRLYPEESISVDSATDGTTTKPSDTPCMVPLPLTLATSSGLQTQSREQQLPTPLPLSALKQSSHFRSLLFQKQPCVENSNQVEESPKAILSPISRQPSIEQCCKVETVLKDLGISRQSSVAEFLLDDVLAAGLDAPSGAASTTRCIGNEPIPAVPPLWPRSLTTTLGDWLDRDQSYWGRENVILTGGAHLQQCNV